MLSIFHILHLDLEEMNRWIQSNNFLLKLVIEIPPGISQHHQYIRKSSWIRSYIQGITVQSEPTQNRTFAFFGEIFSKIFL